MKKKNWFLKEGEGIFLLLFIFLFFNIPFLNAQTCTENFQCGTHQYCEKAIGNCFGIGVCTDRPAPNRVGGPSVCGCDGQTYSNRSKAGSEGVNIAYIGECQITKPVANLATNTYSQNWYSPPNWQNWYYPPYSQNWYSPPSWQNLYRPTYSQNLFNPNWQNWYNPPYLQNWYSPPSWQSWYNPYQLNWYDPWQNWNIYY